MDEWHTASGIVSLIGAAFLSWLVLYPKIQEGVIVKTGLVMMIVSLLVTAALTFDGSTEWTAYWRAGLYLRLGLCITCVGVIIRVTGFCSVRPKRRMSDWLNSHKSETVRH